MVPPFFVHGKRFGVFVRFQRAATIFSNPATSSMLNPEEGGS
jgi:hypothetical protein